MKIKMIMTGQKKDSLRQFLLLEAEDNLTNIISTHRGGNQMF